MVVGKKKQTIKRQRQPSLRWSQEPSVALCGRFLDCSLLQTSDVLLGTRLTGTNEEVRKASAGLSCSLHAPTRQDSEAVCTVYVFVCVCVCALRLGVSSSI